jgi:glycosyltransferase involved in cell wall biosynthesis
MRDVVLNWGLGGNFGWGLLGLNLFAQWAHDADLRPLMGAPIAPHHLNFLDHLRLARLLPAAMASNAALERRAGRSDEEEDSILIDGLGNSFVSPLPRRSKVMIARAVFEEPDRLQARRLLAGYDQLLTASAWTAGMLHDLTGRRAKVIHEGVDTSLFTPGPRSGWMRPDSFYVFSGGKVEFRKGQDLVLLAFRAFAARHEDAVLVTAWQSPFGGWSLGFQGRLERPLAPAPDGSMDIQRWAAENGVDPAQVLDLGLVANVALPAILREMHVALQPSRAEACTSLPVKEAMACGLPVIAALNSGMGDLLTEDTAYVLSRQTETGPPGGRPIAGWGESDVEEIEAALEHAYQNRAFAAEKGARAQRWLVDHQRTWRDHAALLKAWVAEVAY